MPSFVNDAGGKLDHPGLTSNEIFDLVQLASAAYDTSFVAANYDLTGAWTPITASLVGFGLSSDLLKNGFYYEANSFPTGLLDIIYPGTAQAAVFSNGAGDIALAFRGTAEFGFPGFAGDSGDWGPTGQQTHFLAYQDLFAALDAYISANDSVERVLVSGHSLGGAMVERYLNAYTDGTLAGITYEAVAVASPQASFQNDSRVLNIGHDGDIVYSIAGLIGANAVENIYMLFNDGGFFDLGVTESFGAQHDIATGYAHTVRTILSSQFYGETTRNSDIVINYSDQPDDIRELVDDFWTPDDNQLILGRGAHPTGDTVPDIKAGSGTLSIDDHLIGGDGDDWLEGFRGNDTLEGDINDGPFAGGNDTMAGGEGQDLFLGAPEDLNGDVIVDLEIGDRIGTSGATVDPETIDSTSSTLLFNADSGLLDIGGTDVSINATLPEGATLRLLDETLEDGGSILEVVGGGQDIAFVVDTTGSMGDDIASVKASAIDIINAVFDPERGLNDSRIAVVGFNDPTTETVLSFTNQTDPDDRKEAALDAINSLTASGGGDFPELTYTGLLRALDGRAGEWREDAVARKIIVFGDATAKDTELRGQVIALARDLGVATDDRTEVDPPSSPLPMSTVEITEDISLTTVSGVAGAEDDLGLPTSVQIFTVAIGSNPSTISEFESIAADTGGEDFRAADASDIVDTLLEVISLPIYAVSVSETAVDEGDSGATTVVVTVQRDVATAVSDVQLTLAGTADDADRSLATTTVSFAEDETTKTVELSINGDTDFEETETVIVTINSISESATVGTPSAIVTINNDDAENTAPTAVSLSPSEIDEDSEGTTVVGALSVTDPDAEDTHTLELVDDASGLFELDGNTIVLSETGSVDYETASSHDITVRATDEGGLSFDQTLTINVNNLLETVTGDADDNLLIGTGSGEILQGLAGDDTIRGLGASDILEGGDGHDSLVGASGDDTLRGGAGDDTVSPGLGSDIIYTGDGVDLIKGTAEETNGDKIEDDFTQTDVILLRDANLFGDAEFLYAPDEDGIGSTILSMDLDGDGTREFQLMFAGELTEAEVDVEDFGEDLGIGLFTFFGDSGDNSIFGNALSNTINGFDGDDRLLGFAGDDRISGGDGTDTLNGGDGNDVIRGGETESDLRDVIFGGDGNDDIDAGHGNDAVFGGDGNDIIAGGFGVDELQGQDGDDVITGSAFSDLVFGGAGDDFVNGGFGSDRINGGSGADKFFHVGVEGHGSDWLQDYVAADGDVLFWGGGAEVTVDDFQVNFAHTANDAEERSGEDDVQEAFVIYKPTEQILWALVDGGGQDQINIHIGGEVFDLLS